MTRKSYPHHISLYLSDEQHQQLRQLVGRTSLDASKHLRAALALYVEQHGTRKRPQVATQRKAMPTGEVLPVMCIWGD